MTTIKQLLGACVGLALSLSAVTAQEIQAPAAPTEGSGLLGTQYAEYGFGYVDLNDFSDGFFGAGLNVNVPVAANFDVGLSYVYGWQEDYTSNDTHDVSVDGTYYFGTGTVKPFASLSVGYNWNDWDDQAHWGARAGVEIQITSRFVATVSAGYDDDFEGAEGSFDGDLTGHFWFTRKVAGFAGVSLIEYGDVAYAAGVTIRF